MRLFFPNQNLNFPLPIRCKALRENFPIWRCELDAEKVIEFPGEFLSPVTLRACDEFEIPISHTTRLEKEIRSSEIFCN